MADTYTPTSGMKAAARRALKWKEDGKATGAGTPVGWGRATDIVNGSAMSLDTVKRMYSFFSRHEVDKKGKGFYSGPEFPSNGRIMWDAWGGDAGFSWSRAITNRERDKALFGDVFGGIEKVAPCWEGYVQRGMKPGEDGKPVPNCVPASKSAMLNFGTDRTTAEQLDSFKCCPDL